MTNRSSLPSTSDAKLIKTGESCKDLPVKKEDIVISFFHRLIHGCVVNLISVGVKTYGYMTEGFCEFVVFGFCEGFITVKHHAAVQLLGEPGVRSLEVLSCELA